MARTPRRLSGVPRADLFTTSEELAREERNESWDDRIQAEQHQARSLS